jgi:hypothetical protein
MLKPRHPSRRRLNHGAGIKARNGSQQRQAAHPAGCMRKLASAVAYYILCTFSGA